ncbi:MAG TPA: lipid A biosynthesis acyltransferase [Bacteroidales bacterium]|nr:lipid A biosynthesis acyltransferase [Bacteroidales bacterium]
MLSIKDKILLSPLWLIGNMPMWVLHGLSTFFYLLLYQVAGYRKKVVFRNLTNAFPEKSDAERKLIMKKFYKQLCDVFFESLYQHRMTPEESKRRYRFENTALYDYLLSQNKDIICMTGHYANWEWSNVGWRQMPQRTIGVYKPLMNRLFDKYFIYLRTRMGSQVVPIRETFKFAVTARRNKDRWAILLVGDQRPAAHEIKLWVNFLNQDTPVVLGPEKMAQKFDAAVVFFDVQPVKRGYYKIVPELLFEDSKKTSEHEITQKFFETLEKQIRKRPEYYLWSHKRWKYTRESDEQLVEQHQNKKNVKNLTESN